MWTKANEKCLAEQRMTKSKLVQSRKAEFIPDKTFDLDGDGFISQKDYKIAITFDKDGDRRLNT